MKTDTETMLNPYKVGDGATVCHYSDREAFTVIRVTGKSITLQRDRAILLNGRDSGEPDALTFSPGGFCGHTEGDQRYRYERDPAGATVVARMKKHPRRIPLAVGQYTRDGKGNLVTHREVVDFAVRGFLRVVPGRSEHYDFNF